MIQVYSLEAATHATVPWQQSVVPLDEQIATAQSWIPACLSVPTNMAAATAFQHLLDTNLYLIPAHANTLRPALGTRLLTWNQHKGVEQK